MKVDFTQETLAISTCLIERKNHVFRHLMIKRGGGSLSYEKVSLQFCSLRFEENLWKKLMGKNGVATYFDLLVTNMTMKIGANDIFKVEINLKKPYFFTFLILPQ